MRYLKGAVLGLVLALVGVAAAQSTPTIHVGLEAVGTFSWIDFAMKHYGIPEQLGFEVQSETYGSKAAKRIALQSGAADVVVDDITGVAIWRSQGLPVRAVYPYSLATGGVVVTADSDIHSIADLKGKTIAATDLGDKSLLILRTLAVTDYGFDPQDDSDIVAAAPPLMAEFLKRGEVDAAIPPWHYVARMVGTGDYRELIEVTDMLTQLGESADLPILVVVARDEVDPALMRNYLKALDMTIDKMQTDDSIWPLILQNQLYSLPDESLFPDVVARWKQGIPKVWNQQVIDGIVKLIDGMIQLAGPDIVGIDKVDPSAFTAQFNPTD